MSDESVFSSVGKKKAKKDSPKAKKPSPESTCTDSGDEAAKRQFVCEDCGNSFDYKHVLQNHIRTHTGERPFKCDMCPDSFKRDHHLIVHRRLHTGERPCICKCGKGFAQVANLRRHEKSCRKLKAEQNDSSSSMNTSGSNSSDAKSPITSPQESPVIEPQSRVIMPLPTYPASVLRAAYEQAVQNFYFAGVISRQLLPLPYQMMYSFFPVVYPYDLGIHYDGQQEMPVDLSMKKEIKSEN